MAIDTVFCGLQVFPNEISHIHYIMKDGNMAEEEPVCCHQVQNRPTIRGENYICLNFQGEISSGDGNVPWRRLCDLLGLHLFSSDLPLSRQYILYGTDIVWQLERTNISLAATYQLTGQHLSNQIYTANRRNEFTNPSAAQPPVLRRTVMHIYAIITKRIYA